MKKLLACLGLVMAATASGCTLYFGEDRYSDCPPGSYESYDDWGNPVCVPGGGDGWYCSSDSQCAAGCYCDESAGICNEAGYCAADADCGYGMTCDCSSSCVPVGTETRSCGTSCFEVGCPAGLACAPDGTCIVPQPDCSSDAECAAGCYCSGGSCEESSICRADSDCPAGQHCDTDRSTCLPGEPPPPTPSCGGAVTCTFGAPTCPAGQVPTILDGCWTGSCVALSTCDVAPTCEVLNTESDCLARAECNAVYNGQNCTRPDGTSCTMGSASCTCTSFSFDECRAD